VTEYERGRQDGVREEGERILARIREAIASWEREPDLELRSWVQSTLEVLSTCITHRGVTKEEALKRAREHQAEWVAKR
jgi:hypothetical protein